MAEFIELIAFGVAMVMVIIGANQAIRRMADRAIKSDQLTSLLAKYGLKTFKPSDWNALNDVGLRNLLSVINLIQQSKMGPLGLGGLKLDATTKRLLGIPDEAQP